MGNQCCSSHPLDYEAKEAELNVYPQIEVRSKIYTESSRYNKILNSKLSQGKEEFILSIKSYNNQDSEEAISIEIDVKKEAFSFYFNQNYDWKIEEDLVKDPNSGGNTMIITRACDTRTNERYTIKIINFEEYEDYNFKAGLYEIYIMRKLVQANNGQPHPNIISIKDSYIIMNQEKKKQNRTLIIVYEYFDASLHEIIQFRKSNNWQFSEENLCSFIREMSSALSLMESIGISHRDLRPTNIWYTSFDKNYKIGGFGDAKIVQNFRKKKIQQQSQLDIFDDLNTVRGVPQFLAPEILDLLHLNSAQKVLQYDPFKLDVYGLGLIVILMKKLEVEVDYETMMNKVKNKSGDIDFNLGNYKLNSLVNKMICKDSNQRYSSDIIFKETEESFPFDEYKKSNESNLIASLKFRKMKATEEEYLRDHEIIANEYYKLFSFENWLKKCEEILQHHDHSKNDVSKAEILTKIGDGLLEINDVMRAKDYFVRASVIYNELGHKYRANCQLEGSIKYYELAIDSIRKGNNGQETCELALLLENIGNAFRMKGDFQKARAFQEEALIIIAQQKGEESIEAARILNNLGNTYTSLGKYKKADKRIKHALKIIDKIFLEKDKYAHLRSMCLSNLGEVNRLKGNLDKARRCLEEALQIKEELHGSGHIDVAANVENLGNVYFDMGDYHKANKYYEQALVIKKSKLPEDSPEIALTLNNIGNVNKNIGELDQALKFYQESLFILQQKYGQDCEHPVIATTLGNIGLTYKDKENYKEAHDYLEKCLNMQSKTIGEDHPDFDFFMKHFKNIGGGF